MADTGLGIGLGAFQGLMGMYGAYSQNRLIKRVMEANAAATQLEYGQIDAAAALEQRKRSNDVARARGRLRVLAGDSGLDFGGSFEVLDRAAAIDQEINDAITEENAFMAKQRLASGLAANFAQAQAGALNPLTLGIQGGLSGFGTGLSIQGSLDRARFADERRQSAAEANAGLLYSGMGEEIPLPANSFASYA